MADPLVFVGSETLVLPTPEDSKDFELVNIDCDKKDEAKGRLSKVRTLFDKLSVLANAESAEKDAKGVSPDTSRSGGEPKKSSGDIRSDHSTQFYSILFLKGFLS